MTKDNIKKDRNSNLEALRIISMFLIIAYHMNRNGLNSVERPFWNYAFATAIGSWGILGTDLFLIISCWFLVDQKFKFKRIVNILVSVFSYNLLFSIVGIVDKLLYGNNFIQILIGYMYNTIIDFFDNYLISYWFVRGYIIMLLVSPLLNKLLLKIKKEVIRKILLVLCFIPILAQSDTCFAFDGIYFCYIYLLVGYWKKYGSKLFDVSSLKYGFLLTAIILIFNLANYIQISNVSIQNVVNLFMTNTFAATGRHSIILLFDAFIIFFAVIKYKPKHSLLINKIAELTFGVYLFHENKSMHFENVLNKIVNGLKEVGFLIIIFYLFLNTLSQSLLCL